MNWDRDLFRRQKNTRTFKINFEFYGLRMIADAGDFASAKILFIGIDKITVILGFAG